MKKLSILGMALLLAACSFEATNNASAAIEYNGTTVGQMNFIFKSKTGLSSYNFLTATSSDGEVFAGSPACKLQHSKRPPFDSDGKPQSTEVYSLTNNWNAELRGNRGNKMTCAFATTRISWEITDGGTGSCSISDGRTIAVRF